MSRIEAIWPYGLGVAAVAAVLTFLGKRLLATWAEELARQAFGQLANRREGLSRRKLNAYRKQVDKYDDRQPLGFLAVTIDIERVYVPPQVEGDDGRRRDLFLGVKHQTRVVALGSAGAGKSMFVRYWLTQWARSPKDFDRIPVLVELDLFGDRAKTIEDLIRSRLKDRDLRLSDQALDAAMTQGKLCLLLDGLDEVASDKRGDLLHQIRGLATRYEQLQIVVTCREAAWDDRDLMPLFGRPYRLAGFDDAGIRRFLRLWFDTRPLAGGSRGKGTQVATQGRSRARVEQIMAELRASPSLHQLAQSPLVLTMIASVVDEEAVPGAPLASARANFYDLMINHMLRRDREVHRYGVGRFQPEDKKAALRRLAFAAQSEFSSGHQRAMRKEQLLEQIQKALRTTRLDPRLAPDMLEEIVQRSELLVRVEENEGLYEFPHLTLQEYLAALELAHDPDRLIQLYRLDRIRWREVVKLWCGTARRDCSSLVRAVFDGDDEDQLLALECLAEAREIDETLARTILGRFEAIGLDANGPVHQALMLNALGAVAASESAWGREAFEHLARDAQSGRPTSGRAMQALAVSRRPEAMTILTRLAGDAATAELSRSALRGMGEQAIPAFQDRAETGSFDGIDDLAAIATASAGVVLAELVGQPDHRIATRAAWHLARLVMHPDVEEALSRVPAEIRDQATMNWVWEPFESAGKPSLDRLMGRVAYLLWNSDAAQIPEDLDVIDPRVGIPVSMIRSAIEGQWDKPLTPEVDDGMTRLWSLLEVVQKSSAERVPIEMAQVLSEVKPNLYEAALRESGQPATIQRLLRILPWRLRVLGLVALLKADQPGEMLTESSWRRLRHGPPKLGRLAVAAGIATLVVMPIVLTGGIRAMLSSLGVWRWGPSWVSWVIAPCFLAWAVLSFSSRRLPRSRVARIGLAIVSRLALLGTAWFVAATLAKILGWSLATVLVGATVGIAFGLDYVYRRRLRASRNPLRAMLELHRAGLSDADGGSTGTSLDASAIWSKDDDEVAGVAANRRS